MSTEQIDETMELILTIVADETQWKDRTAHIFARHERMILNIEGVMRVRISDVLKELVDEEVSIAESNIEENRGPVFDPSDRD